MPLYEFQNPSNPGEIVGVFMGMNDAHEYTLNGVAWDRVWTVPGMAVDTVLDPFSSQDFLKKTAKSGTIGDLWDLSAEMAAKRQEKEGIDVIKEQTVKQKEAKDKKIQAKNKKEQMASRAKKLNVKK